MIKPLRWRTLTIDLFDDGDSKPQKFATNCDQHAHFHQQIQNGAVVQHQQGLLKQVGNRESPELIHFAKKDEFASHQNQGFFVGVTRYFRVFFEVSPRKNGRSDPFEKPWLYFIEAVNNQYQILVILVFLRAKITSTSNLSYFSSDQNRITNTSNFGYFARKNNHSSNSQKINGNFSQKRSAFGRGRPMYPVFLKRPR